MVVCALIPCCTTERQSSPSSATRPEADVDFAFPPVRQDVADAAAQAALLTTSDQKDSHVGQLVTLKGVVSFNKIATLLGVDIDADQNSLRGRPALATGFLEKTTVTADEIRQAIARAGQLATRGPGIFYRLTAPDSRDLAHAIAAAR